MPIYGGQVSEDGTVLTLGTGACSRDQTASVQETSTEVRIRVKAKQTDLKCASGVIVHLAAPLGGRTVIDRKTGRVVAIG